MEIELSGKTYEARADFAAIMDAEEAEGLKLEEFGKNGSSEILKWLYYFVKRGEELAGRSLEMSRREFCGMLGLHDVEGLAKNLEALMASGSAGEKQPAGKKKG